jgi:hypothetical protein
LGNEPDPIAMARGFLVRPGLSETRPKGAPD